MASHCSTGSGLLYCNVTSVGLIDDAGVACSGVSTVCDHTNSAVTAIPIVPIEKNSLRIVIILLFANSRSDSDRVALQDFAIARKK